MLTSAATARSIPRILRQSARSRVAFTAALAQCTSVSKHSFRSIEHETRSLALLPRTQTGTSFRRYASLTESTLSKTHAGEEKHLQQGKLSSDSHAESEASSAKPSSGARGESAEEEDVDMLAGIKSDMRAIKDTFALDDVPREAYYIGLAGTLPYLATSCATYLLAWDINHAHEFGQGVVFSGQTAELLLHVIEPLQIGYGAVIISFLGAINWGLEFAGYGGHYGYRRFAVGAFAPAVAWPTLLLPIETALISQFLAFNFLYFFDARSTRKGLFPSWYGSYRFVLTFIVGASIVVSLIGRGKIADKVGKLPGPADRLKALKDSQWEHLEQEERERQARMGKEEE